MAATGEVSPVRIGVIGLGRMGSYHVDRLGLREDCRVTAVHDISPDACQRLTRNSADVHATLAGVLRDPRIELLLLATPPATHAPLAIAALEAGKHVIVETPLALTVKDADAIVEASRKSQKMASALQLRRWDDDFRTARATIAQGVLGKLLSLRLIVSQYNPRPGIASGKGFDDWRNDTESGGGSLWESGVHYLDQLLQLAGEEPVRVYAEVTPSRKSPRVDDAFFVNVTFASGASAHVEVDRAALAPLNTGWMITGETGDYAHFTEFTVTAEGEVVDVPLAPIPTAWDEYYSAVIGCVRCGGPNPVPAEEARKTIALVAAARRSARTGNAVNDFLPQKYG